MNPDCPIQFHGIDHVVLQVYNLRKLLHASRIEVVEEELLSVMIRIRTIYQLLLYEALHRRPRVVYSVFKRLAYTRAEHVDAIETTLAVFVYPHLCGEAL